MSFCLYFMVHTQFTRVAKACGLGEPEISFIIEIRHQEVLVCAKRIYVILLLMVSENKGFCQTQQTLQNMTGGAFPLRSQKA